MNDEGPFFHWSPRPRRASILSDGLRPLMPSAAVVDFVSPNICLGPTPRRAWALSGDTDWGSEIERWDLWSVLVGDTDDIRYRTEEGPAIWEIRVFNAIPIDRLWWVGERTPWLGEQ